jgi:hypothetical protein
MGEPAQSDRGAPHDLRGRLLLPLRKIDPAAVSALALIAIPLFFLLPLFRPGEPFGDDLSIHFTEIASLRRSLAAGDLGWWNGSANLGYPSGYYYQILPQLMPALLSLLAGRGALLLCFKLSIAAALIASPLTTWRALVAAGVERVEALAAGAAVALVSSTSHWGIGVDSIFTTGLYTQAWAVVWFPLAAVATLCFLRDGVGRGRAVGWSLLTGLCHPFLGVALVPVVIAAALTGRGLVPWRTALVRATVLLAIVLAASAFFWLPVLVHYDAFGGFPARVSGEEGLAPAAFAGTLVRGALLDGGRAPILTVLVGAALVMAVRERGVLRPLLAAAGACAAIIVIGPSLGKIGDDLFPPIRFLAPLQLAAGAAAGTAAVRLARAFHRRAASARARGLLIAGAAIVGALAFVGSARRAHALVRTTADLPAGERAELDALLAHIAAGGPGRVLAATELGTGSHFWMYLVALDPRTPALRAYGAAALQSSPNFRWLRDFEPSEWYLYDLRWLLARRDHLPHGLERHIVAEAGAHVLVELGAEGLFAPIDVVGSAPVGREARRAAVDAWLEHGDGRLGKHLSIGDDGGLVRRGDEELHARVVAEREAPSRYEADVEVDGAPQTIALKVSWHPAWRATIDGEPARIRRVSPDIMALDVPPGAHRLRFVFRRPWWTWALLLAGVAITVASHRRCVHSAACIRG